MRPEDGCAPILFGGLTYLEVGIEDSRLVEHPPFVRDPPIHSVVVRSAGRDVAVVFVMEPSKAEVPSLMGARCVLGDGTLVSIDGCVVAEFGEGRVEVSSAARVEGEELPAVVGLAAIQSGLALDLVVDDELVVWSGALTWRVCIHEPDQGLWHTVALVRG